MRRVMLNSQEIASVGIEDRRFVVSAPNALSHYTTRLMGGPVLS